MRCTIWIVVFTVNTIRTYNIHVNILIYCTISYIILYYKMCIYIIIHYRLSIKNKCSKTSERECMCYISYTYKEHTRETDGKFLLISTTCAGNWLRTVTSDRNPYTTIRRFFFFFCFKLVGMISLDRNNWGVINLLFVLPGLYLNILKTEEILQFLGQKILAIPYFVLEQKDFNVTEEIKKNC